MNQAVVNNYSSLIAAIRINPTIITLFIFKILFYSNFSHFVNVFIINFIDFIILN